MASIGATMFFDFHITPANEIKPKMGSYRKINEPEQHRTVAIYLLQYKLDFQDGIASGMYRY